MSQADRKKDSALLAKRASQVQGGAARAAVLGVNDGLVSTLCIVLGVAGATHALHSSVIIAGLAGLIAGAISMAAGEWISVQSQVELFRGILADVKKLAKNDKDLLSDELAEDFKNDGMSEKTASAAVKEVSTNESNLFNNFVQHVVGINPDELGSPWTAAISSFLLFTAGSIVALCPWFFGGGVLAIALSIIFTAIGGLGVGAYVARSSGNSIARGALRQLLIIILASVVTYGIGYLFGTTTGI